MASHKEKIAEVLSEWKGQILRAEQITFLAWTKYPDDFGLDGYSGQFPDHHRVYCSLYGRRGLVAKGYLVHIGEKLFRVPKDGETVAEMPGAGVFLRSRNSDAYRMYADGKKNEIGYKEASAFWDLDHSGDPVKQIDDLETAINLYQDFASGNDIEHCRVLLHCSRWMEDRFESLLKLVGKRNAIA